jgi:hypothetical protein
MLKHHRLHHLEVLLGDVECRYGKEHPVSRDIRSVFPKESQAASRPLNAGLSGQRSDTVRQFCKGTGTS